MELEIKNDLLVRLTEAISDRVNFGYVDSALDDINKYLSEDEKKANKKKAQMEFFNELLDFVGYEEAEQHIKSEIDKFYEKHMKHKVKLEESDKPLFTIKSISSFLAEKFPERVSFFNQKNFLRKIFEGRVDEIFESKKWDRNKYVTIFQEGEKIPVYMKGDIKIYFDSELNVFDLYYYHEYADKPGVYKQFGSFKSATKFYKESFTAGYEIKTERKLCVEIQNVRDSKENCKQVFSLDNSRFVELGNFVKIGNIQDQKLIEAYKEFIRFLQLDLIPVCDKKFTNCYGFFSPKNIILPNEYDLEPGIIETDEVKAFKESLNNKFSEEELRETAIKFRYYLTLSPATQLIACYGMANIFRYYFMDNGLKEGSFLALQSQSSGQGKTAQIKIVINLFQLGYKSEGYNESELKGTGIRLNSIQTINTVSVFDDLNQISNTQILSILKSLGTSKFISSSKFTKNLQKLTYIALRGIITSVNKFKITDRNLAQRFILLDLDNHEIKKDLIKPEEDLINYLENNVSKLTPYLWENIKEISEVINFKKYNFERSQSKELILNIGTDLLNKFFNMLGLDSLPNLDIKKYITQPLDNISTQEDNFKQEFYKNIIKATEYNYTDGLGHRAVYNLFEAIETSNFNQDLKFKIIERCNSKGIYYKEDEGILFTNEALKYVNSKELSLKKIQDLKNIFLPGEFEIIGVNQNREKLRIAEKTYRGFLLFLDSENKGKGDTVEDLEHHRRRLIRELEGIEIKINSFKPEDSEKTLEIEKINVSQSNSKKVILDFMSNKTEAVHVDYLVQELEKRKIEFNEIYKLLQKLKTDGVIMEIPKDHYKLVIPGNNL